MAIKLTERGWPGHFICGDRCAYHRNTLLEDNITGHMIIISTVGNYKQSYKQDEMQPIGHNKIPRYYETMAFKAIEIGEYLDADVNKPVYFNSKWAICANSADQLPPGVDNMAETMHNTVVQEIIEKWSDLNE